MGRLTSVSTSAGVSTNYTGYGVQGDILFSNQVTNGKTYKFSYGVAMNSNLLQVNYPSTRAVNLAYGNANEPISVGGTYNKVTTAYIGFINFLGLQETLRAYGGSGYYIWGRTLNNRGQVTNLQLNNWDSPNNSYDYTGLSQYFNYGTSNNNGNLLGSTEYNSPGKSADPGLQLSPAINQSYTYDGVNRLSGVTDNGYSRSYCYDAFGNGWVTASSGQNLAGNTPQDINGVQVVVVTVK